MFANFTSIGKLFYIIIIIYLDIRNSTRASYYTHHSAMSFYHDSLGMLARASDNAASLEESGYLPQATNNISISDTLLR